MDQKAQRSSLEGDAFRQEWVSVGSPTPKPYHYVHRQTCIRKFVCILQPGIPVQLILLLTSIVSESRLPVTIISLLSCLTSDPK